jgi:hypothetical protein
VFALKRNLSMRWWHFLLPLLVLLGSGCARSVGPLLQPGDVVRPELALAPTSPWRSGVVLAIGMLVKVDRPGNEERYLEDREVSQQADMSARLTFLDGDLQLGDPLEVPFVRDC